MRRCIFLLAASLILMMGLWGCTSSDEPAPEKATAEELTERAKEAIQDHINRPLDKARSAQQVGDDRLDSIDQATRQ
jgi:hypothetical protein